MDVGKTQNRKMRYRCALPLTANAAQNVVTAGVRVGRVATAGGISNTPVANLLQGHLVFPSFPSQGKGESGFAASEAQAQTIKAQMDNASGNFAGKEGTSGWKVLTLHKAHRVS